MEDFEELIRTEKKQDTNKIPYKFTILSEYPQHIALAYMPKEKVIKEYIKVFEHFKNNYFR